MVRPYASHHFRPQAFLTMRELGYRPSHTPRPIGEELIARDLKPEIVAKFRSTKTSAPRIENSIDCGRTP